jgi:hypothetical protein
MALSLTYRRDLVSVRQARRMASVSAVVIFSVHGDDRREILGMISADRSRHFLGRFPVQTGMASPARMQLEHFTRQGSCHTDA